MPKILRSLSVCLQFAGCGGYPCNAEDSQRRARADAMRIGVSHDPPFVVLVAGDGAAP